MDGRVSDWLVVMATGELSNTHGTTRGWSGSQMSTVLVKFSVPAFNKSSSGMA